MSEPELSDMPRRNPSYEYRDGFLIHTDRKTDAVYVSTTAALVWGLCDGETPVQVMIEELQAAYPENGEDVREDVLSTLRKLASYDIVSGLSGSTL